MYTFVIKADKTVIEIALLRAILAITAVACFVYANEKYPSIIFIGFIVFIGASMFVKKITEKLKLNKFLFLLISLISLFIISGQIALPAIILLYGGLLKILNKGIEFIINETGIASKSIFVNTKYLWNEFNNVVIKDGLLTFDFKNNRVKYIAIEEVVDEIKFNEYCKKQLAEIKSN